MRLQRLAGSGCRRSEGNAVAGQPNTVYRQMRHVGPATILGAYTVICETERG